ETTWSAKASRFSGGTSLKTRPAKVSASGQPPDPACWSSRYARESSRLSALARGSSIGSSGFRRHFLLQRFDPSIDPVRCDRVAPAEQVGHLGVIEAGQMSTHGPSLISRQLLQNLAQKAGPLGR